MSELPKVGEAGYKRLMEDRPLKWDTSDVNYRPSEGKERCSRCLHFYLRNIDHFGVCEIFRSETTDQEGVQPGYTCDFFTRDGERFPLQ